MTSTLDQKPTHLRATAACLVLLAAAGSTYALWYYRPANAEHRYSQMSLVSLRQLLDRDPDNAKAWRQMALRLAQAGDAAMAEPALKRAFELNPRDAKIATGIGELYAAENRLSDAEKALQAAVTAQPSDATAHRDLGLLYLRSERPNLAIGEFNAVIGEDKRADDAWYQVAVCNMALNHVPEAQDAIVKALAIAPANAAYMDMKGRIDVTSGRAAEGIEETLRAAQAEPKDVRIQSDLINLLLDLHRNTKDLEIAEQTIGNLEQIAPDYPPIPYQRGRLEMLRNHWQDAARYLNIALRAAPQQDDVAIALSETFKRLNKTAEAAQLVAAVNHRKQLKMDAAAVRTALQTAPQNPDLYIQLANLEMQLGNRGAALAAMNSGLKIDPQNSTLLKWQQMLNQKTE